MTEITLYNTRTRRKQPLVPIDPSNVRMYVCGPTVYDRAHIGNARAVVVFDTLYRLLRHSYGPEHVTYVRNFTDVDDKINARAAATKLPGESELAAIRRITDETIQWYHADMDALGALRPNIEPRATEFIGPMVAMISELIARGHAYAAEGHVLFAVASDPDYGKLARRSLEDMRAGARVEVAPYKRDPMDFVLWKPSDAVTPGWDSPWGYGRPGWHIECSAMAYELLGQSFDIHGGGIDLAFPHHENELAQSRCAHPEGDFASIWMHNGMLNVEGDKMSKSLGNFFTVRELIENYRDEFGIENFGPAIRYRLLMAHYRAPLDAGKALLEEAATKLDGYRTALYGWEMPCEQQRYREAVRSSRILDALKDDLNTPQAFAILDLWVTRIRAEAAVLANPNTAAPMMPSHWTKFPNSVDRLGCALDFLGFSLHDLQNFNAHARADAFREKILRDKKISMRIKLLIDDRDAARTRGDFARADAIRQLLHRAGVQVKDSPTGAEWSLEPGFDPAKLEALE